MFHPSQILRAPSSPITEGRHRTKRHGTIRNSEVRGNAFNGIDISQRHGIRGYLPAQYNEFDEELDVEEEFSAFLMDLDSEHSDEDNSGEINCVVEGCDVASNANDGICISGGANVDILGCRLSSNAYNLAVERETSDGVALRGGRNLQPQSSC